MGTQYVFISATSEGIERYRSDDKHRDALRLAARKPDGPMVIDGSQASRELWSKEESRWVPVRAKAFRVLWVLAAHGRDWIDYGTAARLAGISGDKKSSMIYHIGELRKQIEPAIPGQQGRRHADNCVFLHTKHGDGTLMYGLKAAVGLRLVIISSIDEFKVLQTQSGHADAADAASLPERHVDDGTATASQNREAAAETPDRGRASTHLQAAPSVRVLLRAAVIAETTSNIDAYVELTNRSPTNIQIVDIFLELRLQDRRSIEVPVAAHRHTAGKESLLRNATFVLRPATNRVNPLKIRGLEQWTLDAACRVEGWLRFVTTANPMDVEQYRVVAHAADRAYESGWLDGPVPLEP